MEGQVAKGLVDSSDLIISSGTEECTFEVSSLREMLSALSLSSTLSSKAVGATQQQQEGDLDIHLQEIITTCDKYDTKGQQERSIAHDGGEGKSQRSQEEPCEESLEEERMVEATPKASQTLSPWVDGLDWHSQLKRLEQKAEMNRKYEEEVNVVEERFVASAVMVQPSDLEVRIHAEVQGTEVRGTWFLLQGKLPSFQAWVGLFPHRSTKSYADFVYAASTGGEFSFRGVAPGYYQVRLFGNKFITSQIGETELLLVGPKVSLFAVQVKAQEEAALFYYNFDNFPVSSRDWIAIYEKSQKNKSYLACAYGNSHGVAKLSLPRAVGSYEARLFVAGSRYNEQATVEFSVPDTDFLTANQVDGGIHVKWSMKRAATKCSDWIGVYKAGEKSTNYLMYAYTHGAATGEMVLRAPKRFPAGSYQVRIFATAVGKYLSHKGCNFMFE